MAGWLTLIHGVGSSVTPPLGSSPEVPLSPQGAQGAAGTSLPPHPFPLPPLPLPPPPPLRLRRHRRSRQEGQALLESVQEPVWRPWLTSFGVIIVAGEMNPLSWRLSRARKRRRRREDSSRPSRRRGSRWALWGPSKSPFTSMAFWCVCLSLSLPPAPSPGLPPPPPLSLSVQKCACIVPCF